MRILACEYVTGGGLAGSPLSRALAWEADLMIRTLVADLAAIPDVEVVTLRDPVFPLLVAGAVTQLAATGTFEDSYQHALAGVDAAWPIAPETGGALESLARRTLEGGVRLLGCRPDAVRLTARKSQTLAILAAAGIPVVPALTDVAAMSTMPGQWVVKPDDGAGAEGVRILESGRAAAEALLEAGGGLIAQPFVAGEPRSLSMLCAGGDAVLLSVNRQHVEILDDRIRLAGLSVNVAPTDGLQELASAIASTIPGLWGYVGVDYLNTESGPRVLEINPRLTTSFCGLGAALGLSVGGLVLELDRTGVLPAVACRRSRVVELCLGSPHD